MAETVKPKVSVTISFERKGTQPPIYVAGSFTEPPWEPSVMYDTLAPDGEHCFTKKVEVEEKTEYQYKFRISSGDWVLDESAPTAIDESGNKNNVLTAPAAIPAPEELPENTETQLAAVKGIGNGLDPKPVTLQDSIPPNNVVQLEADKDGLRDQTQTPPPQVAAVASEVADSARLLDSDEPEEAVTDEEAGKIGLRRLSHTPIPEVAKTASEVADTARLLDAEEEDKEDTISDNEAGELDLRRLSQTPLPEISKTAAEAADIAATVDAKDANGTNGTNEPVPVVVSPPETERMATLHERTDSKFDAAMLEEAETAQPIKGGLGTISNPSGVDQEDDPEVIVKEEEELAALKAKKSKKRTPNQKKRLKELEDKAAKRVERLVGKEPEAPTASAESTCPEQLEAPSAVEEIIAQDKPGETEAATEAIMGAAKEFRPGEQTKAEEPKTKEATELHMAQHTPEAEQSVAIEDEKVKSVKEAKEEPAVASFAQAVDAFPLEPTAESPPAVLEPETKVLEPVAVDQHTTEETPALESAEEPKTKVADDLNEPELEMIPEVKEPEPARASTEPKLAEPVAPSTNSDETKTDTNVPDPEKEDEPEIVKQEPIEPAAQEEKPEFSVKVSGASQPRTDEPEPAASQGVKEFVHNVNDPEVDTPEQLEVEQSKTGDDATEAVVVEPDESTPSPTTCAEVAPVPQESSIGTREPVITSEINIPNVDPTKPLDVEEVVEAATIPAENPEEPARVTASAEVEESRTRSQPEALAQTEHPIESQPTAEEPNTEEPQVADTSVQHEPVLAQDPNAFRVPEETEATRELPSKEAGHLDVETLEAPEESTVPPISKDIQQDAEPSVEPEDSREPEAAHVAKETVPATGISLEPHPVDPSVEKVEAATPHESEEAKSFEVRSHVESCKEDRVPKDLEPFEEAKSVIESKPEATKEFLELNTATLEPAEVAIEPEPGAAEKQEPMSAGAIKEPEPVEAVEEEANHKAIEKEPEPEAVEEQESVNIIEKPDSEAVKVLEPKPVEVIREPKPVETAEEPKAEAIEEPVETVEEPEPEAVGVQELRPVEAIKESEPVETVDESKAEAIEKPELEPAEASQLAVPRQFEPAMTAESDMETIKEASKVADLSPPAEHPVVNAVAEVEHPSATDVAAEQTELDADEDVEEAGQVAVGPIKTTKELEVLSSAVPLAVAGVALAGSTTAVALSKDESPEEPQTSKETMSIAMEITSRGEQILTREAEPAVGESQTGPSTTVEAPKDSAEDSREQVSVSTSKATGADIASTSEMRQRRGKEPEATAEVSATMSRAETNQERALAPPSVHHNKGFFNTFFRALFVDWIGGFLSRCFGGRRNGTLVAVCTIAAAGVAWWKGLFRKSPVD